ncbi:ABC transporter permease [Leucobacter sp. OLJS4]|uniref:FecCD family ABC transporter permease n=1 Tax=unclassified Leucobacter TaxID=2621730 RepID=UPI000C4F1728|nr:MULTISPECIES: iron chelate uptake ABC transporter family permease subunit [unclassified Leucobacter]PII92850.1 ABC transporter permease [Leucobacter sp. OLAS13]PII97571.1 ABC transporter permease [Leucobacter sp. OLCS4]PII99133.1 ABC transporter permease [Leucobacter sp. OLDS2]PIJ07547.1 ABC transporter permease [Leucobacter sp. OLJS4]PIJ48199.1 ABC transporter permease [Leucobacter sp. OLES1]
MTATTALLGASASRNRRRAGFSGLARAAGLAVSAVVLLAAALASVMIGSALLSPGAVLSALVSPNGSISQITVTDVRVPRTLLGIAVGVALGLAGALMQAVSRNPLADPGLLGVNAGASLAVSIGVAAFGLVHIGDYIWWAFAGAGVASILVFAIASRGRTGATPVRLTLVGMALSSVFLGASTLLTLIDPRTFDRMRFWGVGSITDRPDGTLTTILPFIATGTAVALLLARALNALALGDDVARSVGVRIGATRGAGFIAILLLCGAATAAAGPIAFVGLMIPHAVRRITGPDQRWIFAYALVLAPALVLVSDVLGRLMVWPAELQLGVVTALVGGPVLIALVRSSKKVVW